jgi:hypothetical protein
MQPHNLGRGTDGEPHCPRLRRRNLLPGNVLIGTLQWQGHCLTLETRYHLPTGYMLITLGELA